MLGVHYKSTGAAMTDLLAGQAPIIVGSLLPIVPHAGPGGGHYVEPTLIAPTFLTDYPVELSPLARRKPGADGIVERFEAFCGGMEIANGFSELNDPDDQRARIEEQAAMGRAGDDEAHPVDDDYVTALEYGLPPTGGVGLGIDRLAMLLTGQETIREVVLFPAMRT